MPKLLFAGAFVISALSACVPTPGTLPPGQGQTAANCAQLRTALIASSTGQPGVTDAQVADVVDQQLRLRGCAV
jgi:hypothetical protein